MMRCLVSCVFIVITVKSGQCQLVHMITMFNSREEVLSSQKEHRNSFKQILSDTKRKAHVVIIEQPTSVFRFRYGSEGRSAGTIPGASSTSDNITFVEIKVVGYQGRAVVVVSCVTKDVPHRPHPHSLVGKNCKKGVFTMEMPTDTMSIQFQYLGIQCAKKNQVEQALIVREQIRVDPFRTGFSHNKRPISIDLNTVRLCFQVFLEDNKPGSFTIPLTPVVSEPIYDKKALSELRIFKLSHCTSQVDGGTNEIILLCDKISREDIQIKFYEAKGEWETIIDINPKQVYKQYAIFFKPPKYKSLEVTESVKAFIQLRRPSDGVTGEPLPFELLPLDSGLNDLKRKRQKLENPSQILRNLQEYDRISLEASRTTPVSFRVNGENGNTAQPQACNNSVLPHLGAIPKTPHKWNVEPTCLSAMNIKDDAGAIANIPLALPTDITTKSHVVAQPIWNIPPKNETLNIFAQSVVNVPVNRTLVNNETAWNIPFKDEDTRMSSPCSINDNNTQEIFFNDLDSKQLNSEEINNFLLKENVQLTEIFDPNLFSLSDCTIQQQDDAI